MTAILEQLPDFIQTHIKEITKTSGLPDNDESIGIIAQGWLDKKINFEKNISEMDMLEVEELDKDDERGALVMTYSGSLVNIGPKVNNGRKVEYASIGLRHDVPDMIENEECKLSNSLVLNKPLEFEVGPVKRTSPVFKIAVCRENLTPDQQLEKIKETSTVIIDDFVDVNKTMMLE